MTALRYRALAIACAMYILGVVISERVIPTGHPGMILLTAIWGIVACIYILTGGWFAIQRHRAEGIAISLLGILFIGIAHEQYRLAPHLQALKQLKLPRDVCTLTIALMDTPTTRVYELPSRMDKEFGDFTAVQKRFIAKVVNTDGNCKDALTGLLGRYVEVVLREDIPLSDAESYGKPVDVNGLQADEGDIPSPLIKIGEALRIKGKLKPLQEVSNPGQRRRGYQLLKRGVMARLYARASDIESADAGASSKYQPPLLERVRYWRATVRECILQRLESAMPKPYNREASAVVGSLLFGMHASRLPSELAQLARRSGAVHVLVVSGLHVGFLAGLIWLLARPLGWWSAVFTIIVVATYWLLSRGEPSVTRAAIMVAYVVIAKAWGYDADIFTALAIAGATMVAIIPASLYHLGFQFSFLATAGVVYIAPAIVKFLTRLHRDADEPVMRLHDAERNNSIASKHYKLGSLAWLWYPAVCFGAQVMVAPAIAYHFGKFVLVGYITNLFVVPLVLIFVPCAFATALFLFVAPPIGAMLASFDYQIANALIWLMRRFAELPFASIDVQPPTALMLALIYGALLLLPYLLTARKLWERAIIRRIALVVLFIATVFAFRNACVILNPTLRIAVLDVGQGDCIIVHAPNGRCMMIDGGTTSFGDAGGEIVARERILPFLYHEGIHRIDVLVITHPQTDHIAALPTIIREMPVGMVLDPQLPSEAPEYDELLALISERKILHRRARRGQVINLDPKHDIRGYVLAPPEPVLKGTSDDCNNNSVVIRLHYGDMRVLFTGDAEADEEKYLLDTGTDVRAQILKVAHHGAQTSSTEPFLRAVRPVFGIISCGRHNRFGHPHPDTIKRLRDANVRVLRTDEHGAIIIRITKRGYSVTKFGRRL